MFFRKKKEPQPALKATMSEPHPMVRVVLNSIANEPERWRSQILGSFWRDDGVWLSLSRSAGAVTLYCKNSGGLDVGRADALRLRDAKKAWEIWNLKRALGMDSPKS